LLAGAGDGLVARLQLLRGAHADEAVGHAPVDRPVLQVQLVDRVEAPDDLVGAAQAERAEEDRRQELALAVDADVEQVLRVVLELHPRAAVRDDLRDVERLVFRVEERARRAVQLADDDALGAVDDERAVVTHERDVTEVDLLLLDVADRLHARFRVLVPHDEPDRDLEGHGERHAALLALLDVVLELHRDGRAAEITHVAARLVGASARRTDHGTFAVRIGHEHGPAAFALLAQVLEARQTPALALPVADGVLDELERRVLAEVADREDALEHRLQADVLALPRQAVHLEEPLVGLLLNLNQIRDRNGGLDLGKINALAVDVLGQAVHLEKPLDAVPMVQRRVRDTALREKRTCRGGLTPAP